MKKRGSKRLRRVELVLWALGICLLGFSLAATAERWSYQAEQERALSRAPVEEELRNAAEMETPRNLEMFDPVPAPNSVPVIPKKPVAATPLEETKTAESKSPKAKPEKRDAPPIAFDGFGRIEIPRIGVRAIIRKGADEETLERAVGLVPHTAIPGELGNVVLAAHRDTFFRPLRNIRIADRIRVVVPPHEYVYEVENTRVVAPDDTSVLQSRGAEELTLVTCHPFRFIGSAPDRFIVSAKRVQ